MLLTIFYRLNSVIYIMQFHLLYCWKRIANLNVINRRSSDRNKFCLKQMRPLIPRQATGNVLAIAVQREKDPMGIRKKLWLFVFFSMVMPLIGFSNSTRAQSYSQIKLDPKRVPWTQLSYRIKNFSAGVNVKIQLESLPTAEVEAALIKSPRGVPIKVGGPESNRITVHYMVESIFTSPVTTINQVWFNPEDATALGRIRLRKGKDDFKKVYRFTGQGVYRHRRKPKGQQEILKQPEKWTDVKDTFYAYNLDQLGCPKATGRLVLIYIASASAAEMSKNMKPLSFCVFGRRQLFHVRLKPEGFHSLEVDFIEKKPQGKIHRRGKVQALKIVLDIQPLASDLKSVEDFTFLGFQKDIAIFIDPMSGLPIQSSGKISMVGHLTIKLHKVWLR